MIDYKYNYEKKRLQRVESLSKEMWLKDIMFDYFITILYEKPVKDDTIVAVDNRHLRLLLRRKYKNQFLFCSLLKSTSRTMNQDGSILITGIF